MNHVWKLLPHPHATVLKNYASNLNNATTKLAVAVAVAAAAATTTTTDQDDAYKKFVAISLDVPIGRIELIEACLQSCRFGNNCRVCHGLTLAARFLSKEMFVFPNNSSKQGSSDEVTLIVKKCGRLIRINQSKVEETIPYTIKHGTILSILLPDCLENNSSASFHFDTRLPNGNPLVIQFTLVNEKIERQENHEEEVDEEEDSPELSLPNYSNISKHNWSNSFESYSSPGLLTLQESKSNLTEQDGNINNAEVEKEGNVLLSSLTADQLNHLLNKCDDSGKGRFRRSVLQMTLGDGPLPLLLRSTYIRLNNSYE